MAKNIPIRRIHSAQHEPNSSGHFNIRSIRELLAGKDMTQEAHRHDFFFILALKKGMGRHAIDFVPYKVRDHTIFVLRPGQVHELSLKAGSTGYFMAFGTDFYSPHDKTPRELLRAASTTNYYPVNAKTLERPLAILHDIFREHTEKQYGHEEVIKANLGIFFIELARLHTKRTPAQDATRYLQDRLEAFTALLEKHVSQHKQVSEYADMLSITVYQLNAITKKLLGKTSSQLIDEHIILESKRYLLGTTNQVNQIATELGYEDVSYFIRFFKKHTGYSPEAFRIKFR